ncbi:AraC family transcriptional regulator [Rhizobium leguminosarum]|uniref:AraC family transcriptional regulator n=1 Tax=Rhizobium leguminosarum TaxID=384 RepID=UPI0021B13A57|nr:AraC family transcriptional regulator [Rhizobium leguminosarum]
MDHHDPSPAMHAPSSKNAIMLASRVDLLSQILAMVSLHGEIVFTVELSQPWALRFHPGAAYFFIVLEGGLTVVNDHGHALQVATGDLVMLPRGLGHGLSDGECETEADLAALMAAQVTAEKLNVSHGGGGQQTKLIAGAFRFESASVPWLVSALPSVIHIPKASGETAGWAEGLGYFMMKEAQEVYPGASIMISRLIDVLVISILRSWVRIERGGNVGWLGALGDARISRALKAIHDEPYRRWTVLDLARVAGLSRSGFAARFTALVKEAPLSYHSRWRLTLALGLMRQPDAKVGLVARQVGYDSEAAFSRAFKAQFGFAPMNAKSTTIQDR